MPTTAVRSRRSPFTPQIKEDDDDTIEAYSNILEDLVALCPMLSGTGTVALPSTVKTIEGLAGFMEGVEEDALNTLVCDELRCCVSYKHTHEPSSGPRYRKYNCRVEGCAYCATAVLDEDADRIVIATYGEHCHVPLMKYRSALFQRFGPASVWMGIQATADKLV